MPGRRRTEVSLNDIVVLSFNLRSHPDVAGLGRRLPRDTAPTSASARPPTLTSLNVPVGVIGSRECLTSGVSGRFIRMPRAEHN
jgi:hypothetical protein